MAIVKRIIERTVPAEIDWDFSTILFLKRYHFSILLFMIEHAILFIRF